MTFVDRARVRLIAGTGGSGACSFARFKYKPKGGPDGGDGGRGGSIYVRADPNLATLLDYRYHSEWKADRGDHGKGKTQTGASGSDVYLPVPPGTVDQRGRDRPAAGRAAPRRRHPAGGQGRPRRPGQRPVRDLHPPGAPGVGAWRGSGEEREIELVLKLIADVGLVGEPNAGKSTLLSVLSAARPKIADYPFTTLEPNLGVVPMSDHRTFVVADMPGIIEGAHRGKGLGLRFLQHVERTRVLAFMVPLDSEDHQAALDRLRAEIAEYSSALSRKPYLVLLSKQDLWPPGTPLPAIAAPGALGVLALSGAARTGLDELKQVLWKAVEQARLEGEDDPEPSGVGADDEEDPEW